MGKSTDSGGMLVEMCVSDTSGTASGGSVIRVHQEVQLRARVQCL